MNLWADQLFKQIKTTVKPFDKPSQLETRGPFRISRHPMYLGMVSILVGESLFLGSMITFISPIILFLILQTIFIPQEEQSMQMNFGKEYLRYKKKVRQWL